MKRILIASSILASFAVPAFAQQSMPPTVPQIARATAIACQAERAGDQQTILQLIQQIDIMQGALGASAKQIDDLKAQIAKLTPKQAGESKKPVQTVKPPVKPSSHK